MIYYNCIKVMSKCHVMSSSVAAFSLFQRVTGFFVAGTHSCCLRAKAVYTLDNSPAWGSVSCPRTLRHAAQLSPGELGVNQRPSDPSKE